MAQRPCLTLDPAELTFNRVRLHQTYRQTVYITNTLSSLAEVSVRPGNLERYTVTPASFQLKPNESIAVEVKLRILRFVRTPRTEQQGHRDIFHIKSAFFDQKFYSTFFLDGERGVSDALGRSEGRTGSRQSSPFASPSRSSRSMPSPDQSPTGSPRQPSKSLMPSLDLPAKAGNTRVSVPPLQRHLTTQTRQDEGAGTSKPMRDAWMRYQGEAEDAPTTTGASQGPARRVHELEAENWKLQQQLEELDLDYRGVTVQMHAATRLADELQKENPVVKQAVESAVAVERAAQELRNQKVLELISQKDETIGRIEAQHARLEQEARELQKSLDANREECLLVKQERDEALQRLGEAVGERDALAEETRTMRAAAKPPRAGSSLARELASVCAERDQLASALQAAEKQLNAERTRLDNAHLRVSTLEAQLSALAASAAPGDVAAAVFAHDKEAMALWSRVEELEQQLRAGIPQGADAQIADANIALVERLEDLEQANARMEEALLHATHNSQEEENDDQLMRLEAQRGADRDIRAALLERDRRIGELEGKLAMAQGRADGALNDAEAEVAQMRRELSAAMADSAQKDALLVAAQERLGELEAMCRNAKDVALRAEAAMKEMERAQAQAQEKGGADAREIKAAMAQAARLSARVSELVMLEQEARGEAAAFKEEARAVREEHLKDLEEFERRQHEMRAALEAMSTSAPRSGQDLESFSFHPSSANVDISQQEALRLAAQDAEAALQSVQAQLTEATQDRRRLLKEVGDVKAKAAADTERMQRMVEALQEEGRAMAKQLEERARVSEGQQSTGGEVARLSAEVAALAQSEARARSEAAFAEARAEQLQGELAGAVQGRWGVGSPPYLPQTSREQQEAQHLEAKLTVRAEAAEAEVGRLRAQLACASAGIPEAGYTSTPSHGSTGGLGAKEVELQRQLMLRENDLASAVEEKVSALAEASALRAKLVDAAREVEAAQKRHAECERQLYDRSEAASRRALAASSSFSAELMQLRQQTEEAEREAKAAAAAKAKAEGALSAADAELERVKAELQLCKGELRAHKADSAKALRESRSAAELSKREHERSAGELQERRMQVEMLMDTIETLQAGNPSEREQRLITLTAQIAACRGREAERERQTRELQVLVDGQGAELAELERSLEIAHGEEKRRGDEASALHQSLVGVRRQMESLRQQLNERESAMAATRQELEGCQAMLRKAEAEVEGCRAALAAAGARHMEQLAKERADAAVALRQAKANSLRQALRSTPDASPRTERALQSILEWLEDKQMHREGASAGPGRLELTKGVFERMKSMLLESEQRRSSAETDSRIASGEVLALRARLCALEGALERRTCEWEAVEVARASAERLALRHAEQRLQHFEQQKSLLGRRIQSLEDALQDSKTKQARSEESRISAVAEAKQMRQEAAALGRKLAAAQADASEAAAAAQAAALASEASLAERDAAIYQYFEASVSRALHSSGHKSDHVMGLTRELCALKLVESQLNMQLEAARLHADALAYGSASLRRSLGSAEARISELEQDASLAAGDASGTRAQPSSAPADFTTEKRLLDCEQALAAKDLELREALARAKTSQTEAAHAREELIAAVERLREELALEHAAQMQAMEAEHLASIGRQADAVKQLQEELAQQNRHHQAEREAAISAVLESRPSVEELEGERNRAAAADARAAQLQRQLHDKERLLEESHRALTEREAELQRAREAQQSQAEAISDLEASFVKLEKSSEQRGRSSGRNTSPSPGRRGNSRGSDSGGAVAPQSVARELVHVRLAEADAQRKLRVAAREQLGLRQQLSARQARVQELKGALDSKNKTIEELRRRLEASPLHGRGNSGSRNSPSGKARKKTLALPHTPASPPESVPAEWAVERDDIERFELSLTEGSALLHAEVSSRGEPGLVGQIASLRAELAHRDALVSQLESKLLEALSASRREGEGEAARERDSLKQEAAAALRTAAAVLGGREMAPTIVAAVAALAARLKAAEATTLRSSGGLAPLEAPALTSLEASQRAVIRSLSKRNAVVEGREAAARSDRDRLRSRLDALHNSTGGDVDRDPRPDEEAVSPWGSPEVASVANGDAVAALGMLRLLMHHIAAVRAAARSTAPPDSDAIQQEAASMMATVDVLAAEILQLSKQLVASSGGAPTQDASKDPKDASGSGMQVAVAESWKQRALAAESSLLDVRKQEPAAAQMRQMVVDLQHQVDESEARVEELQQQLAAAAEPPPEGSRGILQLVEWQRKAERAERRVGELEKQILLVPKPESSKPKAADVRHASNQAGEGPSRELVIGRGAAQVREAEVQTAPDVGHQVDGGAASASTSMPALLQQKDGSVLEGAETGTVDSADSILADQDSAAAAGELAILRLRKAKWKQRCIELRTELVKQGEQASTVEAALLERLSAAEQRLGETAFKHSAEITKLKGKLKAAQQKLKTAEDKLREAQDGFIEAEQRAEESKHRAAKLQEKLVIAEATSKSRAQAVETLSKELRTSPSPEKPKAPVQLPRSPLKVRRSRPPEVLVHSGVHLARVQRLDAFLAELKQTNSAEAARVASLEMEIQATLARAQSSERQVIELEKELSAQRQKASAARASQKEELNALRAEVERERRERSQLVLAMRESLGGLKEAGDKESKLKSDLLRAQEQLAAAQAAESAASTLAEERRSGLMDAVADIRHLQDELYEEKQHARAALAERDAAMAGIKAQLLEMEVRIREGNEAIDELNEKLGRRLELLYRQVDDIQPSTSALLAKSAEEIDDVSDACKSLEKRLAAATKEKEDLQAEKEALEQIANELTENNILVSRQGKAELEALQQEESRRSSVLLEQLTEVRSRADSAEKELQALRSKLAAVQSIGEEERQSLVAHSLAELQQLEARCKREKQVAEALQERERSKHAAEIDELRSTSKREILETVERASRETEAKVSAKFKEHLARVQQAAENELAAARRAQREEEEARKRSDEVATELQVELRAYQAQKTEEIGALERRLRLLLEFGRDGPVGRGDEDVAAPGPTPLNQACPEEEGEDDSQPPAIHISVKRTRRGARKGVPIQIPTRVAIPSGVNVKKRAKGRRDASSGEEEEEGAELDSVIQSLMQEAAQSIAMCSPNAPEAGVAGEGDNNKKKGGAPASANAIRENELKRAFQRELELERLQHESAIAKLQSVIERLHQVTGRLKKKIAVQRADVKLKERQALRQLTDHQKQLSQMHSAEEMEQLAGRVQEMEKAALKAKGEISRLRLHIKAVQGSGKTVAASKLSSELEAEKNAREAAESKLAAAKQAISRKEALVNDMKAKIGDLQKQLEQDDRLELIDRAVNAEAKLKATAGSVARKDAQIKALQVRLAEAGKADAKHDQQQAEKEERTIARLRMDLRRRESDVQMLQADLRNAHDALAQAVKGAHEAAQSESTRLMGLDQKLKLQRRVTDDLMSTIRILSRLNLRAAAAMRSAADSARDMIASGRGSAFNAGVNQLDAIADLVGPAGITPSELQSILGMDVGFVPGEDDSVQNVAEALRQLEADLSGLQGTGRWDSSAMQRLLEHLNGVMRRAETTLVSSIRSALQASATSRSPRQGDAGASRQVTDIGRERDAHGISALEEEFEQAKRLADIESRNGLVPLHGTAMSKDVAERMSKIDQCKRLSLEDIDRR